MNKITQHQSMKSNYPMEFHPLQAEITPSHHDLMLLGTATRSLACWLTNNQPIDGLPREPPPENIAEENPIDPQNSYPTFTTDSKRTKTYREIDEVNNTGRKEYY